MTNIIRFILFLLIVVTASAETCNIGCAPIYNTFLGEDALPIPQGQYNTAIGGLALWGLTTGYNNTAVGTFSLLRTNLNDNTAVGTAALQENLSVFNTAIGSLSLFQNTEGYGNTAAGASSLNLNVYGSYNTAMGWTALETNRIGEYNTAVGAFALNKNGGSFNTAIGANAGVGVDTADDVLCLGAFMNGRNISHTTWIKNVHGKTIGNDVLPVVVSRSGQLGTDKSYVKEIEDLKNQVAGLERRLRKLER